MANQKPKPAGTPMFAIEKGLAIKHTIIKCVFVFLSGQPLWKSYVSIQEAERKRKPLVIET